MSVTVHLSGGCANQMFQFATGYALSKLTGRRLLLDTSIYDSPNEWRMYSLGLFPNLKFKEVKGPRGRIIYEQGMPYNPKLFERIEGDITLHGYWQTAKYFYEYKDALRKLFAPGPLLEDQKWTEDMIRSHENSCFVTIRRTDYVGNHFHGLLPVEYYQEASRMILEQHPDTVFFVFTDDPRWYAENFYLLASSRQYLSGNHHMTMKPNLGREDAELYLMSLCKHCIGANSSYSWWGRYLSKQDGISVFPRSWFGPASKEDPRDIYMSDWTVL